MQNVFFTTLRGVSRSASLRVDVVLIKEVTHYERRFMIFERDRSHVLAILRPSRTGVGVEWDRYRYSCKKSLDGYSCKKSLDEDLQTIFSAQNEMSRQGALIQAGK